MSEKEITKKMIDGYAALLERHGFKREVAGEETFNKAKKCLDLMITTGKGCFIGGKCGVGKTLFCKIAADVLALHDYKFVRLGEPLHLNYFTSDDYFQEMKGMSVLLDDIGVVAVGMVLFGVGWGAALFYEKQGPDAEEKIRSLQEKYLQEGYPGVNDGNEGATYAT